MLCGIISYLYPLMWSIVPNYIVCYRGFLLHGLFCQCVCLLEAVCKYVLVEPLGICLNIPRDCVGETVQSL